MPPPRPPIPPPMPPPILKPKPTPIPMPSMTAPGGGPSFGGGLRCTTTSSGSCLCLGVDLPTFFFGGGGGSTSTCFLAGSSVGVVGRLGVEQGQVGPSATV